MAELTQDDLVVGRVINEDDKSIIVEILKDNDDTYTLDDGDRFYTMAFIKFTDETVQLWKPWL